MRLALVLLAATALGAAESAPPAADPAGGAAAAPDPVAGEAVAAPAAKSPTDGAPTPAAAGSDAAEPAAGSEDGDADDQTVDPQRVPGAFGVGGSLDRLQRQHDARNQQLQDLAED